MLRTVTPPDPPDSPPAQSATLRVAWLLQHAGDYWQPILAEFVQRVPHTRVYTAKWSGFLPGFEQSFVVQVVGTARIWRWRSEQTGYGASLTYLSPRILAHLWTFRPQVIFTTAFSIWTGFAILFQSLGYWRVVILYDGSSPGVDYEQSIWRLGLRRWMVRSASALITNHQAGQRYLVETLRAEGDRVMARPYLVPHPKTYQAIAVNPSPHPSSIQSCDQLQRPIFAFIGNVIPRKGLQTLLRACEYLEEWGWHHYSVLVVGDGAQRSQLEQWTIAHGLQARIHWVGAVSYAQVGAYWQQIDVFVFPTFEDVWGLVAVEALLFGKPILCSQLAGAVELVEPGENGYWFDPQDPRTLATLMQQFLQQPDLIDRMGERSRQIMADHTPDAVAQFLAAIAERCADESI